jgi:hypothetical protein
MQSQQKVASKSSLYSSFAKDLNIEDDDDGMVANGFLYSKRMYCIHYIYCKQEDTTIAFSDDDGSAVV